MCCRLPGSCALLVCLGNFTLEEMDLRKATLTMRQRLGKSLYLLTLPAVRNYRTGDRVKLLPEGDILFISRLDSQVKIKGYRIELGEVEQVMVKCSGVQQAVVTVQEDKQGNKRLVGYVVGAAGFNKDAAMAELKEQLPPWMMPSSIIELTEMPLMPNGKVNRNMLPAAGLITVDDIQYQPPRNATEEHITKVWQELLGAEQIGVHDNFFELGGDSIITIQVVSRLKRAGFAATVRDLFIHQTIAKLAEQLIQRAASVEEITAEQGLLSGGCVLLPIQQWFLHNRVASLSHYNQEALLNIDKSIEASTLQHAITELVKHHDALRFRYNNADGHWQQSYGENIPELEIEDLQNINDEYLPGAITERCNVAQQSLDIEKGLIMRVVLMHTSGTQQHNRLFFVIHHLAVDVVSWGILLDDLLLALTAITNGQQVSFGSKGNSYREWYNTLVNYGKTRRLLSQRKYWKQVVRDFVPLATDNNTDVPVLRKNIKSVAGVLDASNTKHLLQHISTIYRTDINDMLLAALTKTMCEWSRSNSLIVALEGHGREAINNDIDIARTVGWFTTIYPVLLQQENNITAGELIRSVKEQIRRIPAKGIGFGVLKYINREAALQQDYAWHIGFNYLGQLNNVAGNNGLFSGAGETAGDSIGQDFMMREKLSLTAIVHEEQLFLNWNYSSAHYNESTIQTLSENYLANLQSLIVHCLEQANGEKIHTPADYGLSAELNYRELEQFLGKQDPGMEDVMTF
jgi:non-ribosomal peptide synthase protein (TIGR01720 family)